jgi:flagellar hook-length control protein FliK
MQIDLMPGATPAVAPAVESTATSLEAEKAPGSFADLLNAIADDPDDSMPVADEADEIDLDPWLTVPVVVPVVPAIPQDIVEIENGDAASVEAIGEDIASTDVDVSVVDVFASIDVKPFVADKAPKAEEAKPAETKPAEMKAEETKPAETKPAETKPAEMKLAETKPTETSAAHEATVPASPVVDIHPAEIARDARPEAPALEATIDTTTAVASKEPVSTEPAPAPKSGKAERTAAASKADDVNKPVKAVVETASSAMQNAVAENVIRRADASSNSTSSEPGEPVSSPKGVAARFARAIERAIEHAVAPAAATGENGQSSNQGSSDGQPSFGEWLREQLPQLAAVRGHHSASPAFSFVAPAQNDARITGVLASSGVGVMPGTPALPNEHDVTLQIVQSMRMQFRDGIGEAVLRLKPEHLGSVSISLRVENGGLKANVQADMPAVRQWLESQQDTLRSALADHGLRLDRFDVEPDAQRQQTDEHGQREQSRKRHSQKR